MDPENAKVHTVCGGRELLQNMPLRVTFVCLDSINNCSCRFTNTVKVIVSKGITSAKMEGHPAMFMRYSREQHQKIESISKALNLLFERTIRNK